VGELSAADIDGDGAVELFVPQLDGETRVLEQPSLQTVLSVADTNCFAPGDVDQVERSDVFCAAWQFTGTPPEGYVVTLLDEATGARMAERVATTETEVVFENLRLSIGRRYAVEVQAYVGAGAMAAASPRFQSDGAELVDPMRPPEILLQVTPMAFVPGFERAQIIAQLDDASPLESYLLRIFDKRGVYLEQAELLNTARYRLETSWDGRDADGVPLPPGEYVLSLLVRDFSGLSRQRELSLTLLEIPLEELELVEEAEQVEEEPLDEPVDAFDAAEDWLEEGVEEEHVEDWYEPDAELEATPELDAWVEVDLAEDLSEPSLEASELKDALVAPGEEWVWGCGCRFGSAQQRAPWLLVLVLFVGVLRRSVGASPIGAKQTDQRAITTKRHL
jgi:hypothetical protein